jgi:hypothetical protein
VREGGHQAARATVRDDQVDVCEDIAQRKESFDAHVGRLGLVSVLHIVSTMTALGSGGCRLCLPVRVLA